MPTWNNREVKVVKFKKVDKIDEKLSVIGFGCWGISGPEYWDGTTDENSIKTIHKAIEYGVNFFDVAPVYGFGHAEEILGKAVKGFRNKIIIATKCGLIWDEEKRIMNNLKPESIFKEVENSLRRLQTDYIDLYQLHWPDPNTDIGETMDAMLELKRSGKIRYIGLSNFSVSEAKRAMQKAEISSMQGLYNMLERNANSYHSIPLEYRTERDILPFCLENGMAFFPYSPLLQGLLTGKFTGNESFKDVRAANPNLSGEKFKMYINVVKKLNDIADKIKKPLSQIALNWLIRNEAVTSVIAGAQNSQQLEENIGAVTWEMDDALYYEIERIVADSDVI